ncbi:hypothetical protein AC629_10960 [Bradyrhizobium sp. NAS80.1]|uniref:hypothetical protein n=1 Tax=Bradyrhizobium sp. NAS80.1 TaxID=1680159 RepID=UPI00095C45DE|nr:hypothetical protein [Bradyrhizobium sp. NAS80.1]OKO88060.1 hypothetical protein AC629_10960 [Bradyrhizobium sp. NAS80.1]
MSFATGTPISDANPLPTRVAGQLLDNTGQAVSPDNYTQSFTYNVDGTVATVSFTDGANTWTQTLTYDAGRVSSITNWVRS